MGIHPARMAKIWEKRIDLLKRRIKELRQEGFSNSDEDVKALYERIRFFEECRKQSLRELAWMQ